MSIMRCRSFSLMVILLFAMKALGGFPYRWGYQEGFLKVQKSSLATIWSLLVSTALTSASMASVVTAPKDPTSNTSMVSTYILNYVSYIIMFLFFPYVTLRSSRLADILRMIGSEEVDIKRSFLTCKGDYFLVIYVSSTAAAFCYINYDATREIIATFDDKRFFVYKICASTCDCLCEVVVVIMSLLIYVLLKLLSLESMEIVESLCQTFRQSFQPHSRADERRLFDSRNQWITVEGGFKLSHTFHHSKNNGRSQRRANGGREEPFLPTEALVNGGKRRCSEIARRLLAFDDIVLKIVSYASPLIIMVLLSGTVNATTMLYLTSQHMSTYYVLYSVLKALSIINIARLPDVLRYKREYCLLQIRKILSTTRVTKAEEASLLHLEKLLKASPEFHVCQLFTLDSRILLPVGHAVVTYVVICFQFGYSEHPPNSFNVTA
ncbi:uncharacterized protein LOC135204030 isoform X1 [Macrobrachium nipponense]|uniref:uncharacterized protein LOC135204030 isoform X1 n=2 Tax=Macrobrachium nipponense TaxID=159736 RepID=UPI0030C8C149